MRNIGSDSSRLDTSGHSSARPARTVGNPPNPRRASPNAARARRRHPTAPSCPAARRGPAAMGGSRW
eukprot:11686720-Alexandrium_andersonii.AAC.1